MKNLLTLLIVLAALALATPLHAIFSLRVGDPRVSASTQQGTIEAALLSVRPKGLYLEYGLYLTFSARGTTYKPGDSLEVTLRFDLPEGAIVHDSWLWIYDDIVRARILDRWTASSIYEDIVKRRSDPSILTKNSATQYELRIFPMRGDEVRKVKITYLVPADWSRETVEAELPVSILKTSKNQLGAFRILTWPDADWQNPELVNLPDYPFVAYQDTTFGQYLRVDLPAAAQQVGLRLSFTSPLKKGYYLRALQNGASGFYQLAVLPSQIFEQEAKRKIMLVIDYEAGAGTVTAGALLQELRLQLLRSLSPADSFNLVLSGLVPKLMSAEWMPADSTTLNAAFQLAAAQVANYSNLTSSLIRAVDFIQAHQRAGAILLASNAGQYGNFTNANVLINDLLPLLGTPPIPVHTLNYNSASTPYFYINGQYYYGNDYFFVNLSRLTNAAFQTVRGTTLQAAITASVNKTGAALQSFDFHTSLASGYCYGRFYVSPESEIAFLHQPILQVGKYNGNFPFKIQLAGEWENEFVSAEWTVPGQLIGPADTLTREMWFGNYIRLLELETNNSAAISEALFSSIEERVLSRYTAFLCLEDTAQLCPNCQDETQLVGVDDLSSRDSLLRAWPNPFTDQLTFEFLPGAGRAFSGSLEIYSASGQLIRLFDLRGSETTLRWDGRDQSGNPVAAGHYVAIARLGQGRQQVLKLVRWSP